MAVTYNKINWDEVTPITVANLDRIDVGIDEVVTQSNSNESRITTNEGDISSNEDDISSNQSDISALRPHNNSEHSDTFLPLDNVDVETISYSSLSGDGSRSVFYTGFILGFKLTFTRNSGTGSINFGLTRQTSQGNQFDLIRHDFLDGVDEETIILGPFICNNDLNFAYDTSVDFQLNAELYIEKGDFVTFN